MTRHPMQDRWSRRQFLQRAAGTAVALPSLAAILAACSKPGETEGGGSNAPLVARPDNPVTLPMNGEPIATDTPIEEGPLQVYNWFAYMYKKVIADFEKEYGVEVEWTEFNNMEEGIQKVVAGQVKPDVFFPTIDYISRLAQSDLVQPLNHELIPNMEKNVWPAYWEPGPWYDVGWRYTVPYTIYTTGVAYRRDKVAGSLTASDSAADSVGYDLLWDPQFKGKVSYYDSYRDAIGMALLRNGDTDPNTGDPAAINEAKEAIMELIDNNDAKLTINGAFAKLPEGVYDVAQSWSGDIVNARFYLPKGETDEVVGYWFPSDKVGLISNDTIVVPASAQNPRLAHEFVNFFLDKKHGYENFRDWNGYQPPFTSIDASRLVADGAVAPHLENAVVTEEMFTQGYQQGQLTPDVDKLWLDAWNEIQAG